MPERVALAKRALGVGGPIRSQWINSSVTWFRQSLKPGSELAGREGKFFLVIFLRTVRWIRILAGNSGSQAGCQPAIQPIANRRYAAGAGVNIVANVGNQ